MIRNHLVDLMINLEVAVYVQNIIDGKEVASSITVGVLSEDTARDIEELTGLKVYGNRITMDIDAVRHIENRHGIHGIQDHSMKDKNDIAKISYILNNYGKMELSENLSKKYKTSKNMFSPHIILSKTIDDIYYVIEAVSDSKAKTNHIVSMYKQKKK